MRKVILLAILLLSSTPAPAQNVPQAFTVQGVLRDGSGMLQSQMVNVTVQFFDAQQSGNLLAGPYGPTAVMATDGLFTLTINDPTIRSRLAGKAQVWLQITVGNDTFPAQIVTPEIYALMCSTADDTAAIQGTPVAATAPAAGQALVFAGGQYAPAPIYPVATVYPFSAVQLVNGNNMPYDTTVTATVTPTAPHGLFLVTLSGQATQAGGAFSLALKDATSSNVSGTLGANGASDTNTYTDFSATYVGMSLTWVEPVADTSVKAHKFVVSASVNSSTTSARIYGNLSVIWFPQP